MLICDVLEISLLRTCNDIWFLSFFNALFSLFLCLKKHLFLLFASKKQMYLLHMHSSVHRDEGVTSFVFSLLCTDASTCVFEFLSDL